MKPGVLLLAYGGPATPAEVRPFVEAILAGRPGAQARVEEIAKRYEAIGGVSPLPAETAAQATALARELEGRGLPIPVFVGMRHGGPGIGAALGAAAAQGVERLVAIVLAPHRSAASREAYQEAVENARRELPGDGPAISWASSWFDHPGYIDALADRVKEALGREPAAADPAAGWILSAHSIPAGSRGAGTYAGDLRATAQSLAGRFGGHAWRVAYQSRSPRPGEPWLTPDLADAIRAAAAAPAVLVIPAGFVAHNLEVLWDIDVEAARVAREAGLRFVRAGCAGTHPGLIRALADSVAPLLKEEG